MQRTQALGWVSRSLHSIRKLSVLICAISAVAGASLTAAESSPALLATDGAWCWFGNPRAIYKDGRIYFGYVRYGDGRVCLNAYDPQTRTSTLLWASDMTQRDDHNNPGLLELTDGRIVAIYAKHGNETRFYYRLSTNAATAMPANWTPELIYSNTTAGVTYANPYQLSGEGGRIYNFMRNLNFNPTIVTSDASGTNWSAPQLLIRTGTGGWRPYVQYCSDFERRIDLTYTDGHPDVLAVPTSLYHLYYAEGALRKTDGTFLKNLADAPLLHDSGERGSVVYQYSSAPSADPNAHIQWGRAWSWDVAYQPNGAPVTAFTVQVTNVMGGTWADDRIYYYYARWTGSAWQKRFIAHAGRPLYNTQRHYAGGISLDPENPNVVYLSSNAADPFNLATVSNVPLRANSRYEVFRGTTSDGGLTFSWQAVTTNSVMDNLRPYVPRKNPYPVGVIWYAGTYTSYTQWDASMYGIFATNLVPVTIVPNAPPTIAVVSPAATPLVLTNLQNGLELLTEVSDDGEPGPLLLSWTTASGPADAVFASTNSPATAVHFPVPGLYTVRLEASDSVRSTTATIPILVGGAGSLGTEPDLPLWLKLDEAAGVTVTDSSGFGHHGSIIGAPVWKPSGGLRKGALEFNGTNSFINVADAPALDNTSALTLAFWLRANAYTTGGAGLVSKRNSLSDNNAYTTFLQTDKFINVDLDGNGNRFTSATPIELGRWYHAAVTFDGSLPADQRARIYINGALDKVATEASTAIPNYNSTLKIGLTHSNVTTYFNGMMDDIRIYRRALSGDEIATLASATTAPSVVTGPAGPATNAITAMLAGSAVDDGMHGPLTSEWLLAAGPAMPVFAESNQAATAVTFQAPGRHALRLRAANAAARVFADLAVEVQPNPRVFADWITLRLPQESNPNALAEWADPDGDAVANFAEFALGMNPGVVDRQPFGEGMPGLPIGGIESVESSRYLVLTMRRPVQLLGVSYLVQVSSDLIEWTPAVQIGTTENHGDGTETVRFRDTSVAGSTAQRYIRLVVTSPSEPGN